MVPFFCAGSSPLAGRDAKFLHGFSASLHENRPSSPLAGRDAKFLRDFSASLHASCPSFWVAGSVVLWCAVHVFGCYCGWEYGFVVCHPRFWVFLWLGGLRRRFINDGDFGEG